MESISYQICRQTARSTFAVHKSTVSLSKKHEWDHNIAPKHPFTYNCPFNWRLIARIIRWPYVLSWSIVALSVIHSTVKLFITGTDVKMPQLRILANVYHSLHIERITHLRVSNTHIVCFSISIDRLLTIIITSHKLLATQ